MIRFIVIDRFTGTENTSEVVNSSILITGARATETSTGQPYLRIEPRVEKGLTITESAASGEQYTTSKIGVKLQPVGASSNFYGFEYIQDSGSKAHEWFLKPKLGAGLAFDNVTGAIIASGAAMASGYPATYSTLGMVIVGNGLDVVLAPSAAAGTLSLKPASLTQLGGVKQGTGVTIAGDGTISASAPVISGTAGYIPKWATATTFSSSLLIDNGSTVTNTGNMSISQALQVSGLSTLSRATINGVAGQSQTVLIDATTGSSGSGLVLSANGRTSADASALLLKLTDRTGVDPLTVSVGGQLTLRSSVAFGADNAYDIGSTTNQAKDLHLAGIARVKTRVTIGNADPNPVGAGSAAPLRVDYGSYAGYNEAAYFNGVVYAQDYVLIGGSGSLASAGPPITVYGHPTAGGTPYELTNTSARPLSFLRFTGTGVKTEYTGGVVGGDLTVTITGGSLATAGTPEAGRLTKFTGTSPNFVVENSKLRESGNEVLSDATLVAVAGTTTIAPLRFPTGVQLASPVAGALEWNGTNLFITQASGPTRKTLAFTDSQFSAAQITSGALAIANGGTGQITATAALNALLPAQATHAGKVLQTDGTNVSWAAVAGGSSVSIAADTTNATRYVGFVASTTGTVSTLNVDTDLTYNPSTNTLAANLTGNASTASALSAVRTFELTGGVTGSTTSNLSGNVSIATTIASSAVTGVLLAGFSAGANAVVASTDSLLTALGKLQGQVSARLSGNQTITLSGAVTGSGATSIATTLASGVVANANISDTAAIADTKLAQITTTGKVANSATTATSANTANAIVARGSDNSFAAGAVSVTSLIASGAIQVASTWKVPGINYSTSNPSGSGPDGALWVVYT